MRPDFSETHARENALGRNRPLLPRVPPSSSSTPTLGTGKNRNIPLESSPSRSSRQRLGDREDARHGRDRAQNALRIPSHVREARQRAGRWRDEGDGEAGTSPPPLPSVRRRARFNNVLEEQKSESTSKAEFVRLATRVAGGEKEEGDGRGGGVERRSQWGAGFRVQPSPSRVSGLVLRVKLVGFRA